ncbi:MAG: hypothetical protein SH847_17390 [Roseiflexaceae bacterium]|nr:hypothetical protein [Roseiflexaceae bacterium]
MQSTNLEPELLALVMAWIEARPFGLPHSNDRTDIPEHLAATITSAEPYRSQALTDACLFLTLPKPIGLGLTAALPDLPTPAPFEPWAYSISPLTIRLVWSETMSAGFTDSATEMLQRVAYEQNRWVIVQFWDEATRRQNREQITHYRQFTQNRKIAK